MNGKRLGGDNALTPVAGGDMGLDATVSGEIEAGLGTLSTKK